MMSSITIRPIRNDDWPAILALQAAAYHALEPESEAVLRSKLTLGPDSCLVASREDNILAYCLAHPWEIQSPAALYHCYPQPAGTSCYYIHDVVVDPEARGAGIATLFLKHVMQLAHHRQIPHLSLIAVQGADRYWTRHQFRPRATHKDLSSYGEQAVYMYRSVRTQQTQA
jgi:ribosomal protein S18 acetylase RimI-like enzyme